MIITQSAVGNKRTLKKLHKRETHAHRQRRGGARSEGIFDSTAVAWCCSVPRHTVETPSCGRDCAIIIRNLNANVVKSKPNTNYLWEAHMEIHELVIEMKLLERRLTLYEEKYGVLSEDFYTALMSGKLVRYDEYDETRADFSRWKGIYETWSRRKQIYATQLRQRELSEALRFQPAY
jgi:hypothetical protein